MDKNFTDIYREIEDIDPISGLDSQSLHVSAEGMAWKDPPTVNSLGISRPQLRDLYYYMFLARKTDDELEKLMRKGLATGKHLSCTGNEATAVGAAYALGVNDWFAPAIRDLGAFLIRGISVYDIFAQACGKADSPTKGWDGSLHLGDRKSRIVGLISHLGTMTPVVSGCAFAMKYYKGIRGAVLAFSGDGATSSGDIHEALNIASVLELPLVLVVENNQWGFGTPVQLQFRCPTIAMRSYGYGRKVEGFWIDGTNVITVYGTVKEALRRAYKENKITIIEAVSMRMKGHSLADPFTTYVPEEQLKAWEKKDPIKIFRSFLLEKDFFSEEEIQEIEQEALSETNDAALRVEKSPQPEANDNDIESQVFIESLKYSNELLVPPEKGRIITYHAAISEAIREEMERDPYIYVIGEDIGLSGGAFKITKGLSEHFDGIKWPESWNQIKTLHQRRVIDAPLAEAGFVGLALGSIFEGLIPIVEFQFADFSSEAFKMIVNYTATQTARGFGPLPIVFRMPSGWTSGTSAFHSVNPESWFASTPGLKIVAPITSFDAKGLLKASVRDGNPVLYLEYKGYYRINPEWLPSELNTPVPEKDYVVPIGKAKVLKEGTDLTVVSYGSQVFRALEAAHQIEKETGALIEVIDLRTIVPYDKECVFNSVKRTSKALVTCEAPRTGCFGQTVVADIQQNCFKYLDGPVALVAGADTLVPFAKTLEEAHLPTAKKLVVAIRELLSY